MIWDKVNTYNASSYPSIHQPIILKGLREIVLSVLKVLEARYFACGDGIVVDYEDCKRKYVIGPVRFCRVQY